MHYPTIGQYLETLLNPDGLFDKLKGLTVAAPPEFSAGAYGVVFRAETGGEPCALKCFTRHQPGRAEAYRRITEALERVRRGSGEARLHLVGTEWLEKEMTVFDDDGRATRYPVLRMEWARGETLTRRMERAAAAGDRAALQSLSAAFDRLARWLLEQPFAHGDLKPDNLIVRPDGELTLIDYDGMYLPEMAGERARERGTVGFRHPGRTDAAFDGRIDDFPIALLGLTLRALARWPELGSRFGREPGRLFDPERLAEGACPAYNFVKTTEWRDDPLFLLLDPDKEIGAEELAAALAGRQTPGRQTAGGYDYAGEPGREGIRVVRRNGRYGFVTESGAVVAECRYDRVREFSEGAAAVCQAGLWGFVGPDGAWLKEPEYEDCGDFSEGVVPVCVGGRWSYADSEFRLLSRPRFDDAWSFTEGRGLVRRGERYGYVGPDGRLAIPARYDFAQRFSEGAACVMSDGLYGYIDRRGRWLVEPQFDYARAKHAGRAYVERDGRGRELEL